MLISASTACWPSKTLHETIEILYDLDFAAIEIDLHEVGGAAKPSELIHRFGSRRPFAAVWPSA
jgi:hypothetical protein